MDICFQVVLFQTDKSFNRAHYYYYIFLFVMFITIPILYFKYFFYFLFCICLPTMLEYELFNFALNVCVFLVYIICNIEGAASFFQCSCLLMRSLPYVCTCVCTPQCAVRSSLPWHAYLTASAWSSATDSSKTHKNYLLIV